MKQNNIMIKRALISVSDKTNLVEFARALSDLNIEIISTGGTSKLLREAGVPVRDVSDLTNFPEMMDGRVKTLHPKVHGGILGKRDSHAEVAEQHNIQWIDLVVVNLYPFAETIKNPNATFEDAIENIDIGGPAMIRSAAKNMEWTGVVIDPKDYDAIIDEMRETKHLSFATRKKLAAKAFQHTAEYDGLIHQYLAADHANSDVITFSLKKLFDLRYGENPHQAASAYQFTTNTSGILSAIQHQGKQLSYNNITDADAAYICSQEFLQPACVIVKHANPCGAAVADNIENAYQKAFAADSTSAFGGIVALNRPCTRKLAEEISKIFFEVLIAPAFEPEALEIFAAKPNLRVLELKSHAHNSLQEIKFIEGGVLFQEKDQSIIKQEELTVVTKAQPTSADIHTMLFAWPLLKHIKSNAILIAKDNTSLGIGAGQVSRIDAVDIAMRKAGENLHGAVLASDAFFPFRDSIDRLANSGIRAVIQPGGSIRDEEVIAACDEHNIAMMFTGKRCFKH